MEKVLKTGLDGRNNKVYCSKREEIGVRREEGGGRR